MVRPDVVLTRRVTRLVVATIPACFVAIFFVWPVVAIIARGISFGGIADVVRDPVVRRIAWFTLWQAMTSTAITVAVGLPVAGILARTDFPGRGFVQSLLMVPFVLPTIVVATAFLALLPDGLHATATAVIIAHVYFNIAVVVRTVTPAWRDLDERLGDAAATLGASPARRLRGVTLPLLRPAILSASGIVFLFTFTSFGTALVLGGPRNRTLDVEIYRRTAQLLDLRGAAALASLQLVALAVLLTWSAHRQRATAVAARARRPTRRRNRLALVAIAPVIAFVLAPLVALAARAGAWDNVTSPRGRGAIGASLRTALIAGLLATIVGGLAAAALATTSQVTGLLDVVVMLPLGTSAVTLGFGMLITFNRAPFDLRGTWAIIPVTHAVIGVPLVTRLALTALRSVEGDQRNAAATLGARPARVWWNVDWPVLRRPLMAGAGFAIAVSLGEFGASLFLARRASPTLPTLIGELLGRPGALANEQAHALAVVLAVLAGGVLFVTDRWSERPDRPGAQS